MVSMWNEHGAPEDDKNAIDDAGRPLFQPDLKADAALFGKDEL